MRPGFSRIQKGSNPCPPYRFAPGVFPGRCGPRGRAVLLWRVPGMREVLRLLQNYRGYPKKFAREIYNNLSVIQGTRLANGMINSCTLCGQCERICPEAFPWGPVPHARQEMVLQKMPPSAHEFALEDLAFGNSPRGSLLRHNQASEERLSFLPGCRLAGIFPRPRKRSTDTSGGS